MVGAGQQCICPESQTWAKASPGRPRSRATWALRPRYLPLAIASAHQASPIAEGACQFGKPPLDASNLWRADWLNYWRCDKDAVLPHIGTILRLEWAACKNSTEDGEWQATSRVPLSLRRGARGTCSR